MSKYLKLSFVAFLVVCSFGIILSCSESDDGKAMLRIYRIGKICIRRVGYKVIGTV